MAEGDRTKRYWFNKLHLKYEKNLFHFLLKYAELFSPSQIRICIHSVRKNRSSSAHEQPFIEHLVRL